jgi:hypothetical protein
MANSRRASGSARRFNSIIKFFIKPALNNITDAGSQAPAWEPSFPKLSLREFWTLTFIGAVQVGPQAVLAQPLSFF